jgi:hypothetical protein
MMDDVLREAERLTHGDRNDAYGPPDEDYGRVVAIYRALTGIQLTAADGALFMVAVKLARISKHHAVGTVHKDSVVDACGYLWVYGMTMHARTAPVRREELAS